MPETGNVKSKEQCKGPYTLITGGTNQSLLPSSYFGLQCTSMALLAIVYWKRMGFPYRLSPKDVHTILVEGNDLHTLLRDQIKISTEPDGMVGQCDIPHDKFLNLGIMWDTLINVKLAHESSPLVTSTTGSKDDFLGSLGDYLRSYRPGKLDGFLITVKCYSYAILRMAFGRYCFFDSHGYTKIMGEAPTLEAAAVVCPTLEHLLALIQGMLGNHEQCDIAPVVSNESPIGLRKVTYEDHVSPEEESPYISMMAYN
ncbi:hypothetical protein ACF0H5_006627 [Mactra antiquata]